MLGLVVLLLAIAIPLGIVALTVTATEAERKLFDHTPVSRRFCAFVFAVTALLAVLWVFRGTGPEYSPAIGLFLGIPAAVIAALIAAASHRFLVGRSKVVASITGVTITILTALSTSALFAVFFAPGPPNPYFAAFGLVIVLSPGGILALLVGGLAGLLLSHLSNCKRPNTPLNPDAPTSGAPVR